MKAGHCATAPMELLAWRKNFFVGASQAPALPGAETTCPPTFTSYRGDLIPLGNVFTDLDLESPGELRAAANSGARAGLIEKRPTNSTIRVQYTTTDGATDNRPEFVELVCLMKL